MGKISTSRIVRAPGAVFAKAVVCVVGAGDGYLEEGCDVSAEFVDRDGDGRLTVVIEIEESTVGE